MQSLPKRGGAAQCRTYTSASIFRDSASCRRTSVAPAQRGVVRICLPAVDVSQLLRPRRHDLRLLLSSPPPPPSQRSRLRIEPRCGGGPRQWEFITCCDCQRRFRRLVADAQWFQHKGLTPAIRCKDCRTYRMTARIAGDDPDGLFPVAQSAMEYRVLRNKYMLAHQHITEQLKQQRRAVKDAKILVAGGKTAYKRQERKATTKLRREELRAARKEAAAAGAGSDASTHANGASMDAGAQHARNRSMPSRAATPEQRLGRE